jgi:hypothetical protein
MSGNLVILRCGAKSLHPRWLDDAEPREWDLHLLPYQELPPQDGIECAVADIVPGPKWSGLRHLLNTWDGWREYDYVWLPDDDVHATQDTIGEMFDVARRAGLDLFAPALHESSHYAHFSTMENRRFHGRQVGFVEIMVPGFRTEALELLLPTLDLTDTGWGWGLDSLWPKLLGYENVGIIDGTPVVHTRPVGQMYDAELRRRVHAESDAIMSDNGCRQMHVTYGGFDPDGSPLGLSAAELLVELVEGYRYLWERDPRVLTWIAAFQLGVAEAADYPPEGTPEVELTASNGAAPRFPPTALGHRWQTPDRTR